MVYYLSCTYWDVVRALGTGYWTHLMR